jgi:cobyrinic acid a,c-diamide synthase
VLNHVSTPRHESLLREAIASTGIPVLGALPSEATLHTPSRHLGLVPAAERAEHLGDWLPRLRELIGRHLDLDQLLAIARSAPRLTAQPWSPAAQGLQEPRPHAQGLEAQGLQARTPDDGAQPGDQSPRDDRPVRIAVAAGRAFTFGYAEHHELLEAAGAEITEFDPMAVERMPAGTDALVVGGGFPQIYVDELAANADLRAEIRERVTAGMPVVAECAGLLWLGSALDDREQCGVLPATARMTGRLTLGYREAVALTSGPLVTAGTAVRAHEFHRTVSEPSCGPNPAWQLSDGSRQGWAGDRLMASYLHLHWASLPDAAARLVATARMARKART